MNRAAKVNAIRIVVTLAVTGIFSSVCDARAEERTTYRRFTVQETDGRLVAATPEPDATPPRWARDVSQTPKDWGAGPARQQPYFEGPIPFVVPPEDVGEPYHGHNHQPAITWLANGDLLAIWYSTRGEKGPELTVLASRLRAGEQTWDPASEFFKAANRNMHGSSIFHDGRGTVYHFNGLSPDGGGGWDRLALLMRTSTDNGVTWTAPAMIGAQFTTRHQVIAGMIMTSGGVLIQPCDAAPTGNGGTALHVSGDGGKTWLDHGAGKPTPRFVQDGEGQGTIAGIHAGVVELQGGRLMALGRGDAIADSMPMSLSADMGKTWRYEASPFPPIGAGQRLALLRLREGAILLVSFAPGGDRGGVSGQGMFAAVSFDEGRTWPARKLLTPGAGDYDGGAWTGRFQATPTRAEHAGYLAATQTPDGVIHLISSRLHYRFDLAWIEDRD